MKRKIYISYVIQDNDKHIHKSEIVEMDAPQYSYSADTLTKDILNWKNEKEQIIISNFFVI
jgi:hypothetical protein